MLKNKFSSSCRCARCSDPTELGTFSSSLLCPAQSCRSAVISADVSDLSSDWRCSTCSKLFPASKISNVTAAIKEQAEKLEFNKDHPEKCGVEAHEAFLKKYKQILHPNHVTLIRVKYNLAKMYGRMQGYEANNLPEKLLQRKRELCEEVLGVFDVIMPGEDEHNYKENLIDFEF